MEAKKIKECMSCSLSDLNKLKAPISDMAEFTTKKDICEVFGTAFVSCKKPPLIFAASPAPKKQAAKKQAAAKTQAHKDMTKCAMVYLNKNGFVVDKLLGQGFNGKVFIACKKADCDYVIKVGEKSPYGEVSKQKKAATVKRKGVGIAPKVYASGTCEKKEYILQDRINGQELLQMFSSTNYYDIPKIIDAIDAYNTLVKNNIYQYDFKANNVMWDNKNRCARIIDYGLADIKREGNDRKMKHLMARIGSVLLLTLIDDRYSDLSPLPLVEAYKRDSSEKFWSWVLRLNKAIYKYLYDNYRKEFVAHLKKRGVQGWPKERFIRKTFFPDRSKGDSYLLDLLRADAKNAREKKVLEGKKKELVNYIVRMIQ